MTSRRIAGPSFFLAVLGLVVLGACSGSVEAIVDDDGGSTDDAASASDARADGAARLDGGHADSGHADGGGDAGTGSDALLGIDAADGGACNALVNGAAPITAMQVASAAPPATGGALVDGTYFMTAVTIYTGVGGATGPLGSAQSVTLQLVGSTAQSVAQSGASATRETTTLTQATLTSLTATATCPSPRTPSTFGYSVGLGTLSVQLTSASSTVVEAFTKQ